MTECIRDLLQFFNSRTVPVSLSNAVDELGMPNVRSIAIEIFSWLKRQRRFGHEKPLELKAQFTSSREMPRFLELFSPMNQLFMIQGDSLTFRKEVSLDDRTKLRELVASEYAPVLRT